mgnify:CR=1 FL=1
MKKLYVYADFDWLKEMELIGELGYESLRGADSYSFTFNNEWLRQHSDLFSGVLTYQGIATGSFLKFSVETLFPGVSGFRYSVLLNGVTKSCWLSA